jgi:hypothetical protein
MTWVAYALSVEKTVHVSPSLGNGTHYASTLESNIGTDNQLAAAELRNIWGAGHVRSVSLGWTGFENTSPRKVVWLMPKITSSSPKTGESVFRGPSIEI